MRRAGHAARNRPCRKPCLPRGRLPAEAALQSDHGRHAESHTTHIKARGLVGLRILHNGPRALIQQLRQIAKDRGYHPRIRVAQAKCLGQCGLGTNIMIYPDNTWYSHVNLNDVSSLADKYLPST